MQTQEIDPFDMSELNTYRKQGTCKLMKKAFRRADLYALPITLRYKGEKKFYTNFGACISAFVIFFILGIAVQ
jgi:hypothetical protein